MPRKAAHRFHGWALALLLGAENARFSRGDAVPECTCTRSSNFARSQRVLRVPQWQNSSAELVRRLCCTNTRLELAAPAEPPTLVTYDGGRRAYGRELAWEALLRAVLRDICGMPMGSADCAGCDASGNQVCPPATGSAAVSRKSAENARVSGGDAAPECPCTRSYMFARSQRVLRVPQWQNSSAELVRRLCCTNTRLELAAPAEPPTLVTYDGGRRAYGRELAWEALLRDVLRDICGMPMGSGDCAKCDASGNQGCPSPGTPWWVWLLVAVGALLVLGVATLLACRYARSKGCSCCKAS